MKVKELIKKLEKVNPNAKVFAEGCDCINEVRSIKEKFEAEMVYINEEERELNKKDKIKDVLIGI